MFKNLKVKIKESYAGIFISLCLSFMLLFYEPLNLYANNYEDFWFDIYRFFPIVLAQFIIGLVILSIFFIVIRALHKKTYYFFVMVALIALICTYIQGNFLASSLPVLNGNKIYFSNGYNTEKMISLLLLIVVSSILIFILWKYKFKIIEKIAKYSSIVIILMLSSSFVAILSTDGFWDSKSYIMASYDNINMISSDKNFVILLLDCVDSSTFNKELKRLDKEDIFTDFTYFPDTLGGYPFTRNSIPFILSSKWYENERKFGEYFTEAVDESPLFKNLESEGYSLNLYESDLIEYHGNKEDRFENLTDDVEIDIFQLFKEEAKLILYKYLPYQLKDLGSINTAYIKNCMREDIYFSSNNIRSYRKLVKQDFDFSEYKVFKFIHLEGAHVPFKYDKDLNVIEDGTYEDNVDASIKIVEDYLDKLKENNVYDNSVIIVMSDHGYGDNSYVRQNPILFIKGVEEHHDYIVSDKKVSYLNLNDAYKELLDGKKSTELFNVDNSVRRYLFYGYTTPRKIEEYTLKGNAWDSSALKKTGKEYILK